MINATKLQEKRIYGSGEAQLKDIIKIHCIAGPRSRVRESDRVRGTLIHHLGSSGNTNGRSWMFSAFLQTVHYWCGPESARGLNREPRQRNGSCRPRVALSRIHIIYVCVEDAFSRIRGGIALVIPSPTYDTWPELSSFATLRQRYEKIIIISLNAFQLFVYSFRNFF